MVVIALLLHRYIIVLMSLHVRVIAQHEVILSSYLPEDHDAEFKPYVSKSEYLLRIICYWFCHSLLTFLILGGILG